MNSTRLPQKMGLSFFKEKSLFEYFLDRIINANLKSPIVVATSTNKEDNYICELCIRKGIPFHRGSENNVLRRFIETAKTNNLSKIIRICADNPFIDIGFLNEIRVALEGTNSDYISYRLNNGTPTIKSHYGLFAEGVTLDALIKVASSTNHQYFHEHVTNFIYEHPQEFNISWLNLPIYIEEFSGVRLTVDTNADFQNCQEIALSVTEQASAHEILKTAMSKVQTINSMEREIFKNEK